MRRATYPLRLLGQLKSWCTRWWLEYQSFSRDWDLYRLDQKKRRRGGQ